MVNKGQEEGEKEQLICNLSLGVAKTVVFAPWVPLLPNPQRLTIYCLSQKHNKSLNNSFLQPFGREGPGLPPQIASIVILMASDPPSPISPKYLCPKQIPPPLARVFARW